MRGPRPTEHTRNAAHHRMGFLALAIVFCGCEDPPPPASRDPRASPPTKTKSAVDPTPESTPSINAATGSVRQRTSTGAPGIRWSAPLHVASVRARPAIAWMERDAFVLGWYTQTGAALITIDATNGAGAPLYISLDPPALIERSAAPGLAATGRTVFLAAIDNQGRVHLCTTSVAATAASFSMIGPSADPRFSPTVMPLNDRIAIAWTDGQSGLMRLQVGLYSMQRRTVSVRDITPPSMGGAAPTWVIGAERPTLAFVDAREGVSPILTVELDAQGEPGSSIVQKPVSNLASPPALAVLRTAEHFVAGFTAVGQLATSAVGMVNFRSNDARPVPIVAGTGYGPTHVTGTIVNGTILFAGDAHRGPESNTPREIYIRALRDGTLGTAQIVTGPEASASFGALASSPAGTIALAFRTNNGIAVQLGRFDPAR